MNEAAMAMPQYQSHKKVWALKILQVERVLPTIAELQTIIEGGEAAAIGGVLTPIDQRYGKIEVDQAYMNKHEPKAGGYYVVYPDGYRSFSPAEAFEGGYTLIGS